MTKITLNALIKKWSQHVTDVREDWSSDKSKNMYSAQFKKDCVKFAKQKRGNAALVAKAFSFDSSYISDWKNNYALTLKKRREEVKRAA